MKKLKNLDTEAIFVIIIFVFFILINTFFTDFKSLYKEADLESQRRTKIENKTITEEEYCSEYNNYNRMDLIPVKCHQYFINKGFYN